MSHIATIENAPEVLALPAPTPQVIDMPAVITSKTSYVPDSVNEVTDLVHAAAERHGIPIESEMTKGSTGLWSHTYRTGIKIGNTSIYTLTILASDNKRRAFMLSVGKETLVCANGMTRHIVDHTYKTRHTAWIRTRIKGQLDHAFGNAVTVANRYELWENKLRSIGVGIRDMEQENYRAVIDGAWSADVARAIHQEIRNPTYFEFRGDDLYAWQERVTTALRTIADRPQAWREAAMHLDKRITQLAYQQGAFA